jgi:hydroxymethylbilane synthase
VKPGIKIGTRGSALALVQARLVADALSVFFGAQPELVVVAVSGDEGPDASIQGKDRFVKELEQALLSGTVDLAVHSLKDLPADLPKGLVLAGVSKREDPREAWVCPVGQSPQALAQGSRVGTASLRRRAFLARLAPQLSCIPMRGNIDTRLRKCREGQAEALVLAAAGLNRLGRSAEITHVFDVLEFLPSPGQGFLGVQARAKDKNLIAACQQWQDLESRLCADTERAFLADLGGDCSVPVAAYARIENSMLVLDGWLSDAEGRQSLRLSMSGRKEDGFMVASLIAKRLLETGGAQLLERLRGRDS